MSHHIIRLLTKDIAQKYASKIVASLDLIPKVAKHSVEQLLSDTKGNCVLLGKWEHSIIMLSEDDKYIGVAIGYERQTEDNEQYPYNCIYLNDLAIDSNHQKQGLGKILLKKWIDHNKKTGLIYLDGDIHFAVQTNSADWNSHVQKLYLGSGFKKVTVKSYPDRVDNVYLLRAQIPS